MLSEPAEIVTCTKGPLTGQGLPSRLEAGSNASQAPSGFQQCWCHVAGGIDFGIGRAEADVFSASETRCLEFSPPGK
jgi:hypothetical protein